MHLETDPAAFPLFFPAMLLQSGMVFSMDPAGMFDHISSGPDLFLIVLQLLKDHAACIAPLFHLFCPPFIQ